MLDAGVVLEAIALVVCGVWCQQVIAHLPRDVCEFRATSDRTDRVAIAVWWMLTAVVFLVMVGLALPIAAGLLAGLSPA